jgi:hypothetical protein
MEEDGSFYLTKMLAHDKTSELTCLKPTVKLIVDLVRSPLLMLKAFSIRKTALFRRVYHTTYSPLA